MSGSDFKTAASELPVESSAPAYSVPREIIFAPSHFKISFPFCVCAGAGLDFFFLFQPTNPLDSGSGWVTFAR